jgi:hypothetical protein
MEVLCLLRRRRRLYYRHLHPPAIIAADLVASVAPVASVAVVVVSQVGSLDS